VLFSVGTLAKNKEILAITASGVSVFRVAAPLVGSSLVIAILMVALNQTVIHKYEDRARKYERRFIDGRPPVRWDRDIFIKGSGDRYYLIDEYNIATRTMNKAFIIDLDPGSKLLDHVIYSDQGRPLPSRPGDEEGWELSGAVERDFDQGGSLSSFTEPGDRQASAPLAVRLEPGLHEILSVRKKPEGMDVLELAGFIERLEHIDEPAEAYRVAMYLQIFFPFSCVVMMLIGIPFALRAQSGRAIASGFGLGILCALLYYALTALFLALGEKGVFPAWFAAVVPLALFSLFGLHLIRRRSLGY
jgi:LPS export ABC transporter permease LptG